MQYRFVKVANLILPLRPASPERSNQGSKTNRVLLVVAIGFAASTLILLVALLMRKGSPQTQKVSSLASTPTAATTLRQLQILQLEQETNSQAEFRSYIPLLSVAAISAGVIFGAYKHFRDRDRDYALRVDQDISLNLNQLLDFTKESGSQNARIASALDNLLWLIGHAKEPVRQMERVTYAIVTAIKEDIDLGNSREARFPALCLEHWPSYVEALKADVELQRLLPYRYNEALTKLAREAPGYFSLVQYDFGRSFIAPEEVNDQIEEPTYQFFVALVDGLWQHLIYVDSQEIRAEALADFDKALNNSRLREQLQRRNKILVGVSPN